MTITCSSKTEYIQLSSEVFQECCRLIEPIILNLECMSGYCRGCGGVSVFSINKPMDGDWYNLLEGMVCKCMLNGRMRLILKFLDEFLEGKSFNNSHILELITPLFPYIAKRIPSIIGSEFVNSEAVPGISYNINGIDVRHEDFSNLSFANNSLDLLMHFDVLEHVPDASRALQEAHRVLSKDGYMVFTCPFYHGLSKNIVRAQLLNGEVHHILPPAYHGNPVSSSGSLVYFHPSLELDDMLKATGFNSVDYMISYAPEEGIYSNGCPFPDGHMLPTVIVARK